MAITSDVAADRLRSERRALLGPLGTKPINAKRNRDLLKTASAEHSRRSRDVQPAADRPRTPKRTAALSRRAQYAVAATLERLSGRDGRGPNARSSGLERRALLGQRAHSRVWSSE
jgi:hypothetical protein